MKLISKFRDYYDYLTGIHGIDPVLVYDRTSLPTANLSTYANITLHDRHLYCRPDNEAKFFRLHITGTEYIFLIYNGKYYHTVDDILELMDIISENWDTLKIPMNTNRWFEVYDVKGREKKLLKTAKQIHKSLTKKSDFNKEHRHPVLYNNWGNPNIPVLDTTPIPRILPAEDIYNEISMFLGWLNDNPEAPQPTDNKSKILAAGFDPKDSFRPKKK